MLVSPKHKALLLSVRNPASILALLPKGKTFSFQASQAGCAAAYTGYRSDAERHGYSCPFTNSALLQMAAQPFNPEPFCCTSTDGSVSYPA